MIAAELLALGHEVLVVERDAARAEQLTADLGSCVVCADGSDGSVLGGQGASRADVLIAVTNEDKDNLVACQVARHHYGVDEVFARVNEPRNERLFERLGIAWVSTVEAMVSGLLYDAPVPFPKRLMTFRQSRSRLISINIPRGRAHHRHPGARDHPAGGCRRRRRGAERRLARSAVGRDGAAGGGRGDRPGPPRT